MDENERYFIVLGCKPDHAFEQLRCYDTPEEAKAYATGFCSNPDMGGFRCVIVKCYAHEDGPYVIWSKYKEDKNV